MLLERRVVRAAAGLRRAWPVLACAVTLHCAACASGGRPQPATPPGETCPPGRNLVCYDKKAPPTGPVIDDRFCRCEQVLDVP